MHMISPVDGTSLAWCLGLKGGVCVSMVQPEPWSCYVQILIDGNRLRSQYYFILLCGCSSIFPALLAPAVYPTGVWAVAKSSNALSFQYACAWP